MKISDLMCLNWFLFILKFFVFILQILLKNGPIKCSHALLQLRANNVEILGGHVVALVEKWEVNRSLAMYAKGENYDDFL